MQKTDYNAPGSTLFVRQRSGGGLATGADQDAEIAVTVKTPDLSFSLFSMVDGSDSASYYPAGSFTPNQEPVAVYSIRASYNSYLVIGWDYSISSNPVDPQMRVIELTPFSTASSKKKAYFTLFKNMSLEGPDKLGMVFSEGLTDRRYFRNREVKNNLSGGGGGLHNFGADLNSTPDTWMPAGRYRLRLMAGVYIP